MADQLSDNEKHELAEHIESLIDSIRAEQVRADVEGKPVQLDQQSVGRVSRIDAIQQQQMAVARSAQLEQQLHSLEAARNALNSGQSDFGYCNQCGVQIPLPRLKINPSAARCVNCAD